MSSTRSIIIPGLLVLILIFLLPGCGSTQSNNSLATNVVSTVIAEQTSSAILPNINCKSSDYFENLAIIQPYNAPVLDNIASIIRTPKSISLNPTGTCLAASDRIGASIIDLAQRQDLIRYLKYEAEPVMVQWSPDGSLIAGSQMNRVVQFWDPYSGLLKWVIRIDDQPDFIASIAWSPDSLYLVTLGGDRTAYIWDVDSQEVHSLLQADAGVHLISAAWSPDGKRLALGTREGELLFAEFPNGRLMKGKTESGNALISIAWSHDGKQLAYSEGNDIRVYDIEAGFPIQRLTGLEKQALTFEWSPDNTMIAAGYAQAHLAVWLVDQGKILFENNEFVGDVIDVEWTQDGSLILTAGIGGIKYWGIPK